MAAGTCVICSCTEDNACEGGCAWVNDKREFCTTCELGAKLAVVFLSVAARVFPTMVYKPEAIATAFDTYLLKDRQALIMAARAIREAAPTEQAEDLAELTGQLNALVDALEDKYPDAVADARAQKLSLAALVFGLIETGGRKVVLAR